MDCQHERKICEVWEIGWWYCPDCHTALVYDPPDMDVYDAFLREWRSAIAEIRREWKTDE